MYLIGVRLKRGTLVAACIALAVGAVGSVFATAGSARPAVPTPVGRRLAAALVWWGWWQNDNDGAIMRSPPPVTVVRITSKGGPPGITVRCNHYRFWIPAGSSMRFSLSNNIIPGKKPPAILSYTLHGRKISVDLRFHESKPRWTAVPLRPGVALMVQVSGGGPERGHYYTTEHDWGPGFPPLGKIHVMLLYSSQSAAVPSGAGDVRLHVLKWAAGGTNIARVWCPQCPGANLFWRLMRGHWYRSKHEPDTQYFLKSFLRHLRSHSMRRVRIMARAVSRSGYTQAAAEAMVISALKSLTQESGYQLEVSGFSACAKKLVTIKNPMAALQMAWLTQASIMNARAVRVGLPNGDTVLCDGFRPPYAGKDWGITFKLNTYGRNKQLRPPTGAGTYFSNWLHARKADFKALLLYTRIIGSVRRRPAKR